MIKTINIILAVIIFAIATSFAQAPQSFKYQAVARNSVGDPLVNQNLGLQISIVQTSPVGSVVYSEIHSVTTNQFGLFNLEIGDGIVVLGVFATIDWGADLYFVKIEMDETGGASYLLMGTSQLLSVPYALYAEKAGNVNDADSTNELQTLSLAGNDLTISNGNTVTLTDNVNDADADSTNELQVISLSNDTIYLTDGGFVVLPPDLVDDADSDPANELQALSISNDTIYLVNGGFVVLPPDLTADADADPANELQALSISNDTIYLVNGGFVVLPPDQVDDADSDPANELQALSISNDTIYLVNGGFVVLPPDLTADADADPANELQAISISNDTIYLDNGGFVVLPPDQTIDADADSTNELQTLSIANDTLFISSGNSVVLTDTDSTNELQMLAMSGDTIFISSTNYIVIPGISNIHGDPNFEFACGGIFTDPRDGETYATVQIGSQCWMAENLNIGTQISSGNQTNNAIIEKYCNGNDAANCITYGGLYQWNEMMQYTTTAGTQGVCPSGWHLPTDVEWMTMEEALGMCTGTGAGCSGATTWRGTTEGDQLKSAADCFGGSNCGISGFEESLAGYRQPAGTYLTPSTKGYIWTSNQSTGTAAWRRYLFNGDARVDRNTNNKMFGFSVRCVKN